MQVPMTVSTDAVTLAQAPNGHPRRGHAQAMRADMLGYLEYLATQGNFLKIPLPLGSTGYYINAPEIAEQILLRQAKSFQKPFAIKYGAKGIFGENLFTSDGELWKVLRSSLQPAFHAGRLSVYADVAAKLTQELLDTWAPGQTVDIPTAMMDLTLGITTTNFFGLDLRHHSDGKGIIRFIELFSERVSGLPLPAWIPTPQNRELKYLVREGNKLFSQLIKERRPQAEKYDDVLSILIVAQRHDQSGLLSDHQIGNEVSNLFAAGYELIGYTLTFTLYLLSQHPGVEQQLMAEIDQVLGDRPPTLTDLEAMPYLEKVLKESMRILPSVALFGRQSIEPVTISGCTIPKNSLMLIAPWTLHHRADIYPEPEKFDPERFSDERQDSIPRFAYLPFSEGPRVCIGRAFAMMQMRINLAMLLQRYRLKLVEGYQFEPAFQFNARPKHGLPMQLEPRNLDQ